MPSGFRENAEDLNTAESVQVDGNAVRRRVDAFTGSDHYRYEVDGIEYDAHWAHDTRRLLDENARLNTEMAARDRTVEALSARLTAKNAELDKTIREAAADKAKLDAVRKIKPQRRNSAMVTSEQLATMHGWNDAVNAIREALEPCECGMTDPSTWTTYGGATEPGSVYEWNPDCPAHGDDPAAAPEMPRPPAEEAREPRGDAGGSTGVPEPENPARAVEWGQGADCPHRPAWHCENHGECRGCECGCDTVNPELDLLSLIPDELVKSDPGIRGGEPCITGTRIPAHEVAGYLADGATWDEVREMLPSLPSLPVPSTEEARDG